MYRAFESISGKFILIASGCGTSRAGFAEKRVSCREAIEGALRKTLLPSFSCENATSLGEGGLKRINLTLYIDKDGWAGGETTPVSATPARVLRTLAYPTRLGDACKVLRTLANPSPTVFALPL